YMSPEQLASSRDVDARTDVWALGAILYELLAGEPAFSGETMPQLCAMILHGEPAPLRDRAPDVSEGLEAVIFRCLSKDRDSRYSSAAALAVALAPFAPAEARAAAERIGAIVSHPEATPGDAPPASDDTSTGDARWRHETVALSEPHGSDPVSPKAPSANSTLRSGFGTSHEVAPQPPRQASSRRGVFALAVLAVVGLVVGLAVGPLRGLGSDPTAGAPAGTDKASPPAADPPSTGTPAAPTPAPASPAKATSSGAGDPSPQVPPHAADKAPPAASTGSPSSPGATRPQPPPAPTAVGAASSAPPSATSAPPAATSTSAAPAASPTPAAPAASPTPAAAPATADLFGDRNP
ncbi:MAG: protein kinase, partial [Polyangiaceae bacterium]